MMIDLGGSSVIPLGAMGSGRIVIVLYGKLLSPFGDYPIHRIIVWFDRDSVDDLGLVTHAYEWWARA